MAKTLGDSMSLWSGLLGVVIGAVGATTVLSVTAKPCPCRTPTPPAVVQVVPHQDGWSLNRGVHYK